MAMRTNRWGQRSSTLPSGSLSLSCVLSLIFTLSRAVSLTLLVCVGVSLSVCLVLSQSVLEQHCTIAFNHQMLLYRNVNKAEYSAQDAPSRRLREGVTDLRTDRPTDGPTDGRTDIPSYRDATAHLKNE